jgi:hypothetical protein
MATATLGQTWIAQDSFASGAFPGLEVVPPNGAEDIVNGLIADDGALIRRGGSTFKTSPAVSGNIIGLWDGFLIPGRRTLLHTASAVYMLNEDDVTPAQLAGSVTLAKGRWTQVANLLIRPLSPPSQLTLLVVGGARPFAAHTEGNASTTQGSTTVTGTGTNWGGSTLTGSVLTVAGFRPVAVKQADSDTQLTLTDPWPYATSTTTSYSIQAAITYASPDTAVATGQYISRVSQMFDRLILGNGNRVSFTHFNNVSGIDVPTLDFAVTTDFHLLPEGVIVTALEPLRDTLLIFTTAGVWGLTGLAFDIVDQAGNTQQRLEQINRDLVLWGEEGLASYGGSVVVPAVNDVYLFSGLGAPQPVTGGARSLYRSYVRQGYQPGQATVYHGHYLLPILDASGSWVDLMVWRLDMPGVPFTRWDGHAAQSKAFTVRTGDAQRQPTLLGGVSGRVEDYTGVFDPSTGTDPDGSSHSLKVTTRTFQAGTLPRFWARLRARFEADDAGTDNPSWSAEVAEGRPGSDFTGLPGNAPEGESVFTWPVSTRARAVRFRLSSVESSAKAVLRSVEVAFRQIGRQ